MCRRIFERLMPSNQFDAVGKELNFIVYQEETRDHMPMTSADKNNLFQHELMNN
jgi:hypothetical protein